MPAICAPKENCSAAAPRSGCGPMTMRAPPLVSQDSHKYPVTMPLLSASSLKSPAENAQSLTEFSSEGPSNEPVTRARSWRSAVKSHPTA